MFRLWLEKVIYEGEGVRIRDAEASDIPEYFIHTTEDPADVLSIQQNGFNMRLFGRTARRFQSPAFLTQYDPRGIYALAGHGNEQYERRPYVLFAADIRKAIVLEAIGGRLGGSSDANAKESLSKLYDGKTGTQLRIALMKDGYQAVLRPGSEQIILDPKIIKVLSVGNAEPNSELQDEA